MHSAEDLALQWTSEELDRAGIPRNRTILSRPGCATPPNLTPAESGLEPWPVFHEVDCAAIPGDGGAPRLCSCGVSPRFKLFGYLLVVDGMGWTEWTREALVMAATREGLIKADGGGNHLLRADGRDWGMGRTPITVKIRRALSSGLHVVEWSAVIEAWDRFWTFTGDESRTLEAYGVPDVAAQVDLSPLTADLRELLQRAPTEDEIKRTMQPLLDHWAVKDHTNG